jgi:hypothetical protein
MDRNHDRGVVMCSEILSLRLQSREGRECRLKVNLEEIWSSGALFQTEVAIPPFTSVWFAVGGCEFRGQVIARELFIGLGYFIEMRFHPGCLWSEHKYRPKHLFKPKALLPNRIFEGTPQRPISPSDGLSPDTFARAAALASIKQSPGNGSEAVS